jgi:hypothetical protein
MSRRSDLATTGECGTEARPRSVQRSAATLLARINLPFTTATPIGDDDVGDSDVGCWET